MRSPSRSTSPPDPVSKHLVTLTVDPDPDGKNGKAKPSTITATDGHLFWLPDFGKWAQADDLEPGTWLRTAAGTWVQVTAVDQAHRNQCVYNLTVDGVHTYYALAGPVSVLVHNDGRPTDCDGVAMANRAKGKFERQGKMTGALYPSGQNAPYPLSSGFRNMHPDVANNLPPGFENGFEHHLEAQAAGLMRNWGVNDADLFISGDYICSVCARTLPDMLPEGATPRVTFGRAGGFLTREFASNSL
ncbi:hypothetical protein J7E96_02850 [Streptomyces sp. ISL-96]|uniref:DddA-like double-stranded DNA deaminase toxin n=1 Tax=Streptomyces sp. ISL-96 TaxID=2819191 RepID=UPI001BEB147A|nr:DddA-like double-stranded DNA deaminase toxin [Streptomyces sp. ISL-96]MBT2487493.1 hypothetical protein [Streptomyces sp. ISL-96]